MRVLLDECVPRPFKRDIVGHHVSTAPEEGFAGLKNGKLLTAAQGTWDVLLTTDDKILSEQAMRKFKIGVLIVRVMANRLETLRSWVPEILRTLPFVKLGTVVRIGDPRLLKKER